MKSWMKQLNDTVSFTPVIFRASEKLEMSYLWKLVVVTWVYTNVKIHRAVCLRCIHLWI